MYLKTLSDFFQVKNKNQRLLVRKHYIFQVMRISDRIWWVESYQ